MGETLNKRSRAGLGPSTNAEVERFGFDHIGKGKSTGSCGGVARGESMEEGELDTEVELESEHIEESEDVDERRERCRGEGLVM